MKIFKILLLFLSTSLLFQFELDSGHSQSRKVSPKGGVKNVKKMKHGKRGAVFPAQKPLMQSRVSRSKPVSIGERGGARKDRSPACVVRREPERDRSFHDVVESSDLNYIGALLYSGIDVNKKDEYGRTPIHIAAFWCTPEICSLLLSEGADVNARDRIGQTALHVALESRSCLVAELLISRGADLDAKDIYGQRPLHIAASLGYHMICELLIERGADIDAQDNQGYTPLHFAAKYGHQKACSFLCDNGAALDIRSRKGSCPFDVAPDVTKRVLIKYALAEVRVTE
mgnify:CR=1 FL=1|jgi:ankyrin repeat protein